MRPVLDAIFGEGFGPNDVFRAWFGVVADLADPTLSMVGFRARLDGAIGLRALWKRMKEAASELYADAPDETLSFDEAWLYGAELLRALRALELPEGPDRDGKCELLGGFMQALRADLAELKPSEERRSWVRRIRDFYDAERKEAVS
jgi:hypothetical protein